MRGLILVMAFLLVPLGLSTVSAEPGSIECGGTFQTGQCRTECNGDFPCCYFYYVLGMESFYWCAV